MLNLWFCLCTSIRIWLKCVAKCFEDSNQDISVKIMLASQHQYAVNNKEGLCCALKAFALSFACIGLFCWLFVLCEQPPGGQSPGAFFVWLYITDMTARLLRPVSLSKNFPIINHTFVSFSFQRSTLTFFFFFFLTSRLSLALFHWIWHWTQPVKTPASAVEQKEDSDRER